MRETTRIVRAMLTPALAGEAMHEGPVFAAPFHVPGEPAEAAYSYGRSHNPTWTALERALGMIESGEGFSARALVFGSGMAAVTAVFGSVLRPGDAVVLPSQRVLHGAGAGGDLLRKDGGRGPAGAYGRRCAG